MLRIHVLALVVAAASSLHGDENQRISKAGAADFVTTLQEVIRPTHPLAGFWTATIEGPALPSGTECLVRVKILNDTEQTVNVTDGEATCGCTLAEITPSQWESGQVATLAMRIQTPTSAKTTTFSTGVHFKSTDGQGPLQINLGFRCRLTGLLCFKEKFYPLVLDGSDKLQSFDIPFLSSLELPDFEIDFDSTISFEHVAIVGDVDDLNKLALTINPALVPDDGTYGQLTIRDKNSSREDSTQILIERERALVVSPQTLRFSLSASNDKFVTAHAMIRLRCDAEVAQGKSCFIEAQVNGKRISLKPKRLSDRVYRVELNMPLETLLPDDNSRGGPSVDWRVVFNDETFSYASNAALMTK